jgi:hypothetical protein
MAAMQGDSNLESDALKEQPRPYAVPADTQRLIDELYREEVLEARAMTAEQKFFLGQQLFEAACNFTLAGIRHQNPDASEAECIEMLRKRLELQRRLEETS